MAMVQHVPNFGHSHSHIHRIEIIELNAAWFTTLGIIAIEDNGRNWQMSRTAWYCWGVQYIIIAMYICTVCNFATWFPASVKAYIATHVAEATQCTAETSSRAAIKDNPYMVSHTSIHLFTLIKGAKLMQHLSPCHCCWILLGVHSFSFNFFVCACLC